MNLCVIWTHCVFNNSCILTSLSCLFCSNENNYTGTCTYEDYDGVADDVLYNWNRAERQVARQDVPLAKVIQTEEEKRQQIEALERLDLLKKRLVVASMRLWQSAKVRLIRGKYNSIIIAVRKTNRKTRTSKTLNFTLNFVSAVL